MGKRESGLVEELELLPLLFWISMLKGMVQTVSEL
jgi:hypothetical protein